MKAVAYCRYSSENQRDGYSIEAQLNAINNYAKTNNLVITQTYIDEAKSGTSDNREAFQQMISDSNKHKFNIVIVHKLDRFARDRYDSAIYKKKLSDNGVAVHSVLERLDDSPESVIMEGIIEAMAEYYSKNLSREVKKGKDQAALKCKFNGGVPAYGYDVDSDRSFKINSAEATVVKEVFNRLSTMEPMSSIADSLNARGIKNKLGNPFTKDHILTMRNNKKYIGIFEFGKGRVTVNCPELRIISDELFNRVHELADERHQIRKAKFEFNNLQDKESFYFLQPYMYCGCCEKRMTGNKSEKKTKLGKIYTTRYYRCTTRFRHSELCDNKLYVHKDKIEKFTVNLIESLITSDAGITKITKDLKAFVASSNTNKRRDDLLKQREKLTKQVNKLIDLYLNDNIDINAYTERKSGLEAKIEALNNELVGAKHVDVNIDFDAIKKALAYIKTKSIEEYEVLLVRTFLKKIVINKDTVEFFFNLHIKNQVFNRDSFVACKEDLALARLHLHATTTLTAIRHRDYASLSVELFAL